MLNSNSTALIYKLTHALIFTALFSLYSCMPTSSRPSIDTGNTVENGGTTGSTTTVYPEPTFPLASTFIQEGATRSLTNISMPVDFVDSFLVRGKTLSQYLRTLPTSTKFCMVGSFTYISGSQKFLIMSAKPKSYTDLAAKTTEFYLQVEPSNDTANQNDCLTYNLTNSLYSSVPSTVTPSVFFSFSQLCSDCTTSVTSGGLQLYFANGESVPTVTTSALVLTISGSTTSSTNSCSDSTACKARGFDCCLQSQCVNDGSLRPGANDLAGFLAAQEDVRLNPDRFTVYPQFFFVCESRPDSTGGSTGGSTSDPDYEASVRLMELKQLYDCLNQVDGEFSYCTLKFTQANESMPGDFSASANGYNDDINFSSVNPALGSGDYQNNIVKIVYGGQTLYEQNKTALTAGTFKAGTSNDNITSSQVVNLNATLPSNAKDANLYLTYKVDGTCQKISTTLAKCTKSYIHASSDTTSSMWHDSSKTYVLPPYADTSSSSNLIVKVSGIVVPEDTSTWSKGSGSISFAGSYAIYQNQKIEITYFVNSNSTNLIKLRTAAQATVNTMCTCTTGTTCGLKPIPDPTSGATVNYECTYNNSTTVEPPVNQTVYVSNKNIAHRYFDANGVSYDEDYGSALDQEGTAFSYTNNDVLKPNNVSQYVGFNEIYGSFAKTGTYIGRPAKKVSVKKDKLYDILTVTGVFSSCTTCGSDYYTSLQKIFPQNFGGQGGGYQPDNYASSRVNNTGTYRSDDLLFGRACFVPATMIPWTHTTATSPRDQRRQRLSGQHFLFANGYNRDWYGFDYGSLIGSFDGVTWFSIGNQRRIKATSSKLYLAVNAYVGDLNVDSNFTINVYESTAFSSDIPDHDTETDGAQCQKSHFCSNDNDCFRQLGYDYSCQNVASVYSNWPQFDAAGSEVIGSVNRSLLSIVGGSNGQAKRCMYRGRGTPCIQNLDNASSGLGFNSSTVVGTSMCSPNNSCVAVSSNSKFNDRIARFANTPLAQNIAGITPLSDTVGMGARVILRPYEYYGTKPLPANAQISLVTNKVDAICVPGKDINNALDNFDLNQRNPSNRIDSSDKLYSVGPASSLALSPRSLNACPATDAAGTTLQVYDLPLGDPQLNMFSISQNLSSNLLNVAPLTTQNIFSSTNGSQVTAIGYQRNSCLRAPGASCFSDMECAPSEFIATKAKTANLAAVLNTPEAKYWEEELVCGNPDFKRVSGGLLNPLFDLKKNKCCREFGKVMTVYTQKQGDSSVLWCAGTNIQVAGVNVSISTPSRYSRVHSVYEKMTCDRTQMTTTKKFALSLQAGNAIDRLSQLLGQYKTLDTLNQRTCCTQHWVRSFATENGGGHVFAKTKMQNIDKAMFKHVSWAKDDETSIIPTVNDPEFECDPDQYLNASCEVKSFTPAEEEKYLTWAGSLELIGIPQVAIGTNNQVFQLVDDDQKDGGWAAAKHPLRDSSDKDIVVPVSGTSPADFSDGTNTYYSGANYSSLNMVLSGSKNSMKKVFSESEFNCCVPSGQEVPDTTTASQCCTGFKATTGVQRCCLPDFTDLTVYLNRYVSSEGRGLPDSAYDEQTGYIKDPGQVQLMAAQKSLCCSGNAMMGVAISQLSIPLKDGNFKPADTGSTTRRFNYRTDSVDNNPETGNIGSVFDAGVRWNNHVYCVPTGFGQ
jgi:hypothetical protein